MTSGSPTADQDSTEASKPTIASHTTGSPKPAEDSEKLSTPSFNHHAADISVKDYQIFITIVLTISIFGASTFAIIAGQMEDPAELWKPRQPPFSLSTVRRFLAVAWLCFILTIATAGYSSSLLTILRKQAEDSDDQSWHRNWDKIGIAASALMHLLLVMAFLFLSLGLVAYVGAIGWVGVGFSCLAGTFVIGLSVFQCRVHHRQKGVDALAHQAKRR